jgi:hypothetical protein|tara:strand:+ start:3916 stop:4422 length:507 start_codon:yes stop_codon:yes gene_type:complete
MALKPDRHELLTDISFFMNETAERGVVVVHSTAGSGSAMDDGNAVVTIPTTASGTNPAGLLLNDVVNIDLTRQHLNHHQDEIQKGGKVTLLKQGWVVTNKLDDGGDAITAGASAYFASSGLLTTARGLDVDTTAEAAEVDVDYEGLRVGRFMSSKDADGYAKVYINIS